MNIYSALQIGDYHINHCEDYLFIGEIGTDKVLCAVMDGCTQGIDSYFASTLVGKILRKISVEKGYNELYQSNKTEHIDDYLKSILCELFKELTIIKNQLMLDKKELLTTLIILLLDKKSNQGIVLTVGDGLVCIDGAMTEYDQENKPDYLGFHITENFENWYINQTQKIQFENIQDISIATDGIFMFKKVKKVESADEINALDYLIHDKTELDKENMLDFKLKKLERIYGIKPTDDLAVIRIIN